MYRLPFGNSQDNLLERLQSALQQVSTRMTLEKEGNKNSKMYVSLHVNFYKASSPDEITNPPPCFNTEPVIILPSTDNVQNIVKVFYDNLLHQVDRYEKGGSGWVLLNLVNLDLNIAEFDPMRANDDEDSDDSDENNDESDEEWKWDSD